MTTRLPPRPGWMRPREYWNLMHMREHNPPMFRFVWWHIVNNRKAMKK